MKKANEKANEYVRSIIENINEQLWDGITMGGPGYGRKGVHIAQEEVMHAIVVNREESDARIFYKVWHSQKDRDTNYEISDGWPKPVIASFVATKERGYYGVAAYYFLLHEKIGFSLTRKGAEKKIKQKAEDLASLISEETGVPIVRE